MPLANLFDNAPYLAHMAGWDIFNRLKNYFENTLVRVFLGTNGFMMQPQGYAYTGDLIGLCMAMAAAAWVTFKAVDQSVVFNSAGDTDGKGTAGTGGFASNYRLPGVAGWNNLGLYEMLITLTYMCWSILIIILSFVFASQIWEMIEAREVGVKADGSGGVALDEFQAAKICVLTILTGMMSIVGAYSIGSTVDELILWFQNYVEKNPTKKEACNNGADNDSNCDLNDEYNGVAIGYDTLYHVFTIASSYILWFAISIGAYIFAFVWGSITEPAECDTWDTMSSSQRQQALNLVQSIDSLTKCKETLPQVLDIIDLNGNGLLERCEDANFLHLLGNTKEYAKKYSHRVWKNQSDMRCEQLFNRYF